MPCYSTSTPNISPNFFWGPISLESEVHFYKVCSKHLFSEICLHSRTKRVAPNMLGILLGGGEYLRGEVTGRFPFGMSAPPLDIQAEGYYFAMVVYQGSRHSGLLFGDIWISYQTAFLENRRSKVGDVLKSSGIFSKGGRSSQSEMARHHMCKPVEARFQSCHLVLRSRKKKHNRGPGPGARGPGPGARGPAYVTRGERP